MARDSTSAADSESRADAILRVCSYHRRDFDFVLIRSPPHDMQPVASSMREGFEIEKRSMGIGILDGLPSELVTMVLHNIDLQSYFRFRHVSRQARMLATRIREYVLVASHGLEAFRALLRARLAPSFTITDLYSSLVTPYCACGEFGGFLFLPTATRCCFACIRGSPEFRVQSRASFSKTMRLSAKNLSSVQIPVVHTVPGTYSMMDKPVKRPRYLVATTQAVAALIKSQILNEGTRAALNHQHDRESYRFMASTAFPYYDSRQKKADYGVSCKGCQIRAETRNDSLEDRDRVFSEAGFSTHFEQCKEAQNLWTESRDGTEMVVEPEFTRRRGYFVDVGPEGLPR